MFLLAEELSGVFNNVFKTLTNVISFTEVKNQFLKSLENAVKYQIYKQTFYSSTGRMFVHNFGANVIRTFHYFKNVSWAESRWWWWWWSCVRRGRMSWFLRTDQIIYFHARRSKVSWWETGRGVKRGKQHISHVMLCLRGQETTVMSLLSEVILQKRWQKHLIWLITLHQCWDAETDIHHIVHSSLISASKPAFK